MACGGVKPSSAAVADIPPPVRVSRILLYRLHFRLQEHLPMWVVYRPGTREYPGVWAARMHLTLPEHRPTRYVFTHDTLAELRTILPPGLTNIGREPGDEPAIEEVWL